MRICEWMCVCVIHRMYAYGIVSECSEWEYVNVVLISFSTNWNERKRHEHRNKREIYNNNNNKPYRKNLRNNNSNNRSWSSLVDVVNLVCSVVLFYQNNTNWSILWFFWVICRIIFNTKHFHMLDKHTHAKRIQMFNLLKCAYTIWWPIIGCIVRVSVCVYQSNGCQLNISIFRVEIHHKSNCIFCEMKVLRFVDAYSMSHLANRFISKQKMIFNTVKSMNIIEIGRPILK